MNSANQNLSNRNVQQISQNVVQNQENSINIDNDEINYTPKTNFNPKQDADEKQRKVYQNFTNEHFLGKESTSLNFMLWVTFFRRNLHRFAIDYLGIKLHLYQIIWLYLMGINNFFVVIASRASAKSWIIALYACCKCILYPNMIIILSSSTKGQSKLLLSDKIEKDLMGRSPVLRREIKKIVVNQAVMEAHFRNGSVIKIVPALDSARGARSHCVVREECRMIKKSIDDSVLSPFQISRQPDYMTNPYYSNIKSLQEESIDIYISSSWFDNNSEGSWMWDLVDTQYKDMLNGKPACVLAFDESVALKHAIRTQKYFQTEKKKQDPITWRLEFMNERLKENHSAFFTWSMLNQNQIYKRPFYPRTTLDYRSNKKNPYAIPKVVGEIRIVSCDMAFITNNKNDNSIFSCVRLLPENVSHKSENDGEMTFDNGYRMIIPYLESMQGGEIKKQAMRIREIYDDFNADYICLDTRNAGIGCYDLLARVLYDDDRGVEYSPLSCMNDENIANRIKVEGAEPRIFAINASQKLNSDIALNFRQRLCEKKIDFLVNFETAKEEILPNIKEYVEAVDAETAILYEKPFLETQALFAETAELMYEKKADTGVIVIREQGTNRKDRYTSVSYAAYLCSLLERDLVANTNNYEYAVFIN